jgi:hypothetical protein
MAKTVTRGMWRIARTDSGTPPIVYELPEAANQTFPANCLVTVNANGEVAGETADDATVFWGVAENAGQNAAAGAKKARVYRLTTDLVFIGTLVDAAAANHVAVPADHGSMGVIYDDPNRLYFLDASEQGTADDRVWVLGLAPGSEMGDTNAQFYFKFLASAIQGN